MSEYQYYEFLAVDRPLTDKQIEAVRRYSTRAEITTTRFVNEYHWGDFKGSPDEFLKRFFDVFVYLTNWGTHQFAFRVPTGSLDLEAAQAYASDSILGIKQAGDVVIFDFLSESEPEDWEEGNGWMASLAPVREEILSGDYRALYLAWLAGVHMDDLPEDDAEPPLPAGLRELSGAQMALVEFIRVDEDLLAAAAEASPAASIQEDGLAEWIAALPEVEKNELLTRLCDGSDPHGVVALRRRFQAACARRREGQDRPRRTVGELLASAKRIEEERREKEAQRRAREKARQAAEAARVKAERLNTLAGRQPAAWREVEALAASKQPGNYEKAIEVLRDLQDLAAQQDSTAEFTSRLTEFRARHGKKSSLMKRLVEAGLVGR